MTPTLLLDLDNTLLGNEMGEFLPAYLKLLAGELAPYVAPDRLVRELMLATEKMASNRRPDCTLQEIFESVFYPAIGVVPASLQAPIESFYQELFPTLQALTQPRPFAVPLVETALQRGWQVAIATNPHLPRAAVAQRLAWAGLPPEQYPFALATSYEDFHYSKPHPAYYAEILARLGWPEGPVVMVGDDPVMDIAPASALGLSVFQITSPNAPGPLTPNLNSGALEDVLPWLDQAAGREPDFSQPASMLATLWATPAALDTFFRPMSAERWKQEPAPGEWSPTELVCHLRDVETEVNLPRLQKVLAEKNPFLPGEDTDIWAEQRGYAEQNGPNALARFTAARLKVLGLLESLSPAEWQRTARHAILGTTTLAELIGIIAAHDRLHVRQILGSLNTRA